MDDRMGEVTYLDGSEEDDEWDGGVERLLGSDRDDEGMDSVKGWQEA